MGMHFPGTGQRGAGRVLEHIHSLLVHPGLRGDVGAALGVVGQLVGIPVIVNGNNRSLGLQGNLVKGLGLEVGHFLGGGFGHLSIGACQGLVSVVGRILHIGAVQSLEPVPYRIGHGIRSEGDGDRDVRVSFRQRNREDTLRGDGADVDSGGIVGVNCDGLRKRGLAILVKRNDLHDGSLHGHIVLHHIDGDPDLTGREDGHIVKGAHISGIGGKAGGAGLHHGTVAVRHRIAQNRVATAGGGIFQGDGLGFRQHNAGAPVGIGGSIQLAVHKGGGGNGGGNALIGEPAIALHIQRVGQVDGVLGSLGGSLLGGSILGGSILGGSGFHRDDPGLNRVALCVGDGGIALGHTENLGNVLFAGVSFFRPDSGGGDIVTCPLAAVFSGSGQLDAAVHIHGGILGRLFLGLGVLSGGILSLGVLSRGILSRGILSLGLLNCGFLSRRFLGFGFLSRRFLDLGFLSSRLHDGRLRLGDYRGGGAEREGVGRA